MNPILTILLNPIARKVHHARAAATSAVSFLMPENRTRWSRSGEAFAPAGFIGRSANPPRRHLE